MIRLFNADSLAAMRLMPDKAYDLAIAAKERLERHQRQAVLPLKTTTEAMQGVL